MLQNLNLNRTLRNSITLAGLVGAVMSAHALTLPAQTTIPVAFVHSIDARKAKAGDVVTAKAMQQVELSGGETIPKGTLLVGHVVEASAFQFDETPYAKQKPSLLAIQFDKLVEKGTETPVHITVRAVANAVESWDAEKPTYLDESDHVGTMYLIGGGQYSPLEKKIVSSDEDEIVGYNKKHGTYARLFSADYAGKQGTLHCDATQSEQAIGIFSPQACGAYGFSTVSLSQDTQTGAFRLTSTHDTVKLYAGSTALVEVQPAQELTAKEVPGN
jgi:hypothetical protein